MNNVPIVFVDTEGNIQPLPDVDIVIKEKIMCDNKDQICDAKMKILENGNGNASDDFEITNLGSNNVILDKKDYDKVADDVEIANLDCTYDNRLLDDVGMANLDFIYGTRLLDDVRMANLDCNNDGKVPNDAEMSELGCNNNIILSDNKILSDFSDNESNLPKTRNSEVNIGNILD